MALGRKLAWLWVTTVGCGWFGADAPEGSRGRGANQGAPSSRTPKEPAERSRGGTRLSNAAADPGPALVARVPPTPVSEASAPASPVATPTTPPNVVVVIGCTVRKDQLTPYGGPAEATPHLAELAAEGVLFDDLIAAAPWTRAASTAILTGRHPVSIGMVEPRSGRNNRVLPASITTMAEVFQARGYYTVGATANPNLAPEYGFDQGYDDYQVGLSDGWNTKRTGSEIASILLETLAANREGGDARPFFLRVMLLDAHSPRDAGRDAWGPVLEDGEPERVAQYRVHLRRFDDALATLDAGLQAAGFDGSNTLFVVVADHGEGMNYPKHHGFSHGQYHMPSTNHVPWVLRGPGVAEGHRVLGVASQVDVLPTILGVIGGGLEEGHEVDGVDLSGLVRGEGAVTPHAQVWSDTWFGEANRAAVWTPTHQCQHDFGSSKRQRKKGKFVDGCHDRHADPLLATEIEQPELMDQLMAWRGAREAELQGTTVDAAEVSEDLADQLEVLGYRE